MAMSGLPLSQLVIIIATIISLGCVNFVLVKELYTAYGDEYSFFVNQGVNFLYIVYGGAILYPRMCLTNAVTPAMMKLPKKRFVVMGFLDALGTFFTAMGATFTPGSMQPLLNQTLIPWIMLASRFYLQKIYSSGELGGAGLILVGACVSALPPLMAPHSTAELRWYAVFFYALSNVPMAMSACYKESNFKDQSIDVWYLTQWVSIFQFLLSFLFMPLLCLPGFGSVDGTPLQALPGQFWDGFECFLQTTQECAEKSTFILLVGYCGVNVMYNTLGLYLVKEASALTNALTFAMLLPCTTLLFFTPIVGAVQEHFSVYNWFTVLGLILVLFGFALYQHYGRAVDMETDALPAEVLECLSQFGRQPSFQERVIGLDVGLDVAEARKTFGPDWELVQPLLGKTSVHIHRYRHEHGNLPPHWHEVVHDHEHEVGEHHGHGPDLERSRGHHNGCGHVHGPSDGEHGHTHCHGSVQVDPNAHGHTHEHGNANAEGGGHAHGHCH